MLSQAVGDDALQGEFVEGIHAVDGLFESKLGLARFEDGGDARGDEIDGPE